MLRKQQDERDQIYRMGRVARELLGDTSAKVLQQVTKDLAVWPKIQVKSVNEISALRMTL